ncbi:MAG: hypothetical protein HC918_06630, partial [Oscillatoriales cyanobacterium SM2_1_8]|nr:hypothetical protein [Oscillatoriales cyanobacterium SM2_1_8]
MAVCSRSSKVWWRLASAFRPRRDVAAGQALIEGQGWALNSDGVYEKDGEALAVEIMVNNAS